MKTHQFSRGGEMADAADSRSVDPKDHEGSSPSLGILVEQRNNRVVVSLVDENTDCTLRRCKNWEELNTFIHELEDKGKEAWGPDYSDPAYDI
jgi:hypothetical protein